MHHFGRKKWPISWFLLKDLIVINVNTLIFNHYLLVIYLIETILAIIIIFNLLLKLSTNKKVLMRSSYYIFFLLDKILYSTLKFFEILHIVLIYSMKSLAKQWKKNQSINQTIWFNLFRSIEVQWNISIKQTAKKNPILKLKYEKKLQSIINHDKLKLNVGRKKKKSNIVSFGSLHIHHRSFHVIEFNFQCLKLKQIFFFCSNHFIVIENY